MARPLKAVKGVHGVCGIKSGRGIAGPSGAGQVSQAACGSMEKE